MESATAEAVNPKSSCWWTTRKTVLLPIALARPAAASPTYAGVVADTLGLDCTPPCTLWRLDGNGGLGTAVRPVGTALREAGLRRSSSAQVRELLGDFELEGQDSDADGFPDVDELRANDNPNLVESGTICVDVPVYGCSVPNATGAPFVPRDLA